MEKDNRMDHLKCWGKKIIRFSQTKKNSLFIVKLLFIRNQILKWILDKWT